MKNRIADLHIHPGMKGYANHGYAENEGRTIWDLYPKKEKEIKQLNFAVQGVVKELSKESQAHLDACAEGMVHTPFISICPPERPMFALEPRKPFKFLISLLLPKKKYATLAVAVTAFPKDKVDRILKRVADNKGVDYYNEEYVKEWQYLIDQTKEHSRNHPEFKYRIARDFEEFNQLIEEGHTIVTVLTVEGAHSFGHYPYQATFKKTYEELTNEEKRILRGSFLKNIKEEKNKDYTPFFVTFSHHFNNLLAGHARSMSAKSSLINGLGWPNLPGMRHIFNQEANLNAGFSPLGREVLNLFLDKTQGKRILIDAKHMSIASRHEFYRLIRRKREEENDPIPILYSHAAVSGWPTLAEANKHSENKDLDKNTYFSRWQINLTDEDILNIYDSDGRIGLVLHEDRMPGGKFKRTAKKHKKEIEKYRKSKEAHKEEMCFCNLRECYLELLWSNAFHIVKTVRDARNEDGWKIIALGSDYDGLINPFNVWLDTKCFQALKNEMLEYLMKGAPIFWAVNGDRKQFTKEEIVDLLFGRTPEEAVDDIFYNNVHSFMASYFTPEYLGAEKEEPVVVG